jgi:pimeloyl-ACP methyl ester carboxylesterase
MTNDAVVLVHGAQHGAWCWDRIRPHFALPSVALDLPGRGSRPTQLSSITVQDLADAIVADVEGLPFERVVLVAHSMAGLSAPLAAAKLGCRVRHLVLVSSMVPAEGARALDSLPLPLRLIMGRRLQRAAVSPAGTLETPRWLARMMFCNDMSAEDTAFVLDMLCPDAPGVMLERVSRQGLDPSLPRSYISLRRDRALPPSIHPQMAANIGADLFSLDAGHDAMFSAPRELAQLVQELVQLA